MQVAPLVAMRYHALALDYDGTIAHHGRVDASTVAALEKLRATGRHLIMVTGRELPELLDVFPEIGFFEWVVAENGALLYRPATKEEKVLAERPPDAFVDALRAAGVGPMSVGRAIVATWEPHETTVLQIIRDMGLELQVIFNKGAVMVLPAGVTKASGLLHALQEVKLTPHEVVGVGDAENDHAFLSMCECSCAVSNALPSLKERVDYVASRDHGGGVAEVIEMLAGNDLSDMEAKLTRHHLLLGKDAAGADVNLPPYGKNILIAGPSGSGKSTLATALLERLAQHQYQFCIIDPEGDYDNLEGTVALGSNHQQPVVDELLSLLSKGDQNAVANFVGVPLADRPPHFLQLLPRLHEMRARTARPHWVMIDEAHHLLPASWEPGASALPGNLKRTIFITVHPDQLAPAALESVGTLLAVGDSPEKTIDLFCKAMKEMPPAMEHVELESGEVLLWRRDRNELPIVVKLEPGKLERQRHIRKYAEGELPPDRSFYFRGPEGKLNLRAQNLMLFLQLADGVDDDTWLHHLRQGDYSTWFRERIKNDELAAEVIAIEKEALPAKESREAIRAAVLKHYTLPTTTPLPIPDTDAAPTGASS